MCLKPPPTSSLAHSGIGRLSPDQPVAELYCTQITGCTLAHWGRVTHICVGKQTIIGPDNGLSPSQRQAIIWTNAGILLIQTLGTHFSEIFSEIPTFSFKKPHVKMSSVKRLPFCLDLSVLTFCYNHYKNGHSWRDIRKRNYIPPCNLLS